uniref:Uncharacterized protein n=1 Tax=Romanomermis culicivorax TaxID=13658 RepID=A0A915L408_ROMCU
MLNSGIQIDISFSDQDELSISSSNQLEKLSSKKPFKQTFGSLLINHYKVCVNIHFGQNQYFDM